MARVFSLFLLSVLTAALLWSPGHVHAQTVLKVPFGSAQFAWDVPPSTAEQGVAVQHVLTCGVIVVKIPMPTTSIPVSSVVPGPGTYDCTLYAENEFGRQAEPNVPFPQFQAGNRPGPGTNLRIQVQ